VTIRELIDLLNQVKDKDKPVMLSLSSARVEAQWSDNFVDQPHQLLVR
jgi:hypothetical protein